MKQIHTAKTFNIHEYERKKECYELTYSMNEFVQAILLEEEGNEFDEGILSLLDDAMQTNARTHRWTDGQTFVVTPTTLIRYYTEFVHPDDDTNAVLIRTSQNGCTKWSSWREIHPLEMCIAFELN